MLKIQNLSFSYAERQVLKNINLEVKKGETLALLGPNGSGKSTLLRAISGLLTPSHGTLSLAGHPLAGLRPAERARWISVVPQNAILPPAFTAWETVLLGRTPHINFLGQVSAHDEAVARGALEKVDALSLAGRCIGELSGGEQQRVLLARALAQAAPILLLDEATSALDTESEALVQEALDRFMVGRTTIVIAHRLSTIINAHRVLVLDAGRIVEEGAHAELLAKSGLYQELYQRQFDSTPVTAQPAEATE